TTPHRRSFMASRVLKRKPPPNVFRIYAEDLGSSSSDSDYFSSEDESCCYSSPPKTIVNSSGVITPRQKSLLSLPTPKISWGYSEYIKQKKEKEIRKANLGRSSKYR